MAASTKPINQAQKDSKRDVRFWQIAAGVLIPQGTLAVNDAGSAKPFTDTLFQGGAGLLGFAQATYDNSAGGAAAAKDMLFARDCEWTAPAAKGGDVPTLALVGKAISIQDNQTVKATIGGSDISVTLLEILPGSAGYRIALP